MADPTDDTTDLPDPADQAKTLRGHILTPQEKVDTATAKTRRAAQDAARSPFALPTGIIPNESEQGVSFGERLLLKNLASNPQNAVNWLRQKGYEAYTYEPTGADPFGVGAGSPNGQKMRIAVKKPEWDHFKVVDPAGFDVQDLTDLIGDLVFGGTTAAMATEGAALGTAAGALTSPVTGPVGPVAGFLGGGAVGGAAGGAASEFARQETGNVVSSMFGQPTLNPTPSMPEVKSAALGGTIAAPVGAAVGAAGRGVASVAKGIGQGIERVAQGTIANLARVQPQQLAEALARRQIILRPDLSGLTSAEVAQRTMQFLTGLDDTRTAEYQAAQGLLAAHGSGEVRLRPTLQAIRDAILSPFREVTTPGPSYAGIPTGPSTTTKIAQTPGQFGLASADNDRIRSMLAEEAGEAGNLARNAGADSVEEAIANDAKIPVAQAETLKREYAQKADYAARSLEKDSATEKAHTFLANSIRRGVQESIPPGPEQDRYIALMKAAGKKLGVAKELQDALIAGGAEKVVPEKGGPEEVVQAANRPEQFFRSLLARGARSGHTGLVREFGRLWAPELTQAGLGASADFPDGFAGRARLASAITGFRGEEAGTFTGGPPKVVVTAPGMSFGGEPLGASLGGLLGGAGGYMMGGPTAAAQGAAGGAALGAYAATPRGSIRSAQVVRALARGGAALFGFPGKAAASTPGRFLASTASARGATSAAEASTRARTDTVEAKNVDAETLKALDGIYSDVRSMMAKNPNFTQADAAAEFKARADRYLTGKRLVMVSP